MSNPKDSQDDQDPDYATPGPSDEAHQKIYEENARTNVARKITTIVDKEFSKEIDTKEKEILLIEERLHKALKTLHFLRYVIITDFYNRKQCQAIPSTSESKQTRIHPAIKQIIGKSPRVSHDASRASDDLAVPSTSKDPWNSNSFAETSMKIENTSISEVEQRLGQSDDLLNEVEKSNTSAKNSNGKRSQEDSAVDFAEDGPPKKIPRYVPPKSGIPEPQVPSRGARHKVRKRIVVGNISKWIPPDWREDAASHKWTMYVRGSKENADIADFVGKVRFFLHPSYRPNDVVEVTSPPFHLSRRGWGEFPLRVQLHFKNPLNKPMDIIHYLKLDRTYTGLQTLGSETVVDVWIKISEFATSCDSKLDDEAGKTSIDIVRKIKEEPADVESPSNYENSIDHCAERIKEEPQEYDEMLSYVHFEHDYANFPTRRTRNTFENENNVTISHSPPQNNDKDSLSLSSINGESERIPEKNSTVSTIYEEVITTCDKESLQPETQRLKISNGNYIGNRDARTKNCEIHANIESNSTTEFDGIDLSNIQASVDVATMASSLENSSPMLQPLKIAIPAAFEALRRGPKNSQSKQILVQQSKQILLLKDNKLIPINSTKLVVSGLTSTKVVKPIMQISRGVSLLKKPPNPPQPANDTEKLTKVDGKMLIKLNPTNSLILNSTNNIPALRIAEPGMRNNNEAQRLYIEKKPQHQGTISLLTKGKNKAKETTTSTTTEHWLNDVKIVTNKPKITIGKDRLGASSKKESYEEILRSIEEARITEVPALVRFIIRRLPLISEKATDPEYRTLHPYACSSEKEYLDSNVGKQRALEWYRAKHVKSFLRKKDIPDEDQWSIKEIMIWSRLHGYTPIRSILPNSLNSRTSAKSSDKNLPGDTSETSLCTVTEPSALVEFLKTVKETKISSGIETVNRDDEIEIIDVESVFNDATKRAASSLKEEKTETRTMISLGIPEKIVSLQSYVSDTARQIGVKLVPEEIVPGVTHCAPARMIVRAVQCLLEDLLRSSLAKAWERSSDGGVPDTITLEDVRGAILNREEFDVFTNEGLGSHHCPED